MQQGYLKRAALSLVGVLRQVQIQSDSTQQTTRTHGRRLQPQLKIPTAVRSLLLNVGAT